MREQMCESEASNLFSALKETPPVSVRLNPRKPSDAFSCNEEKVAFCDTGRYLAQRPQFTLDPLLHAGCYYVQEASSMSVEQAFRALPETPRRVLDLCAAPGGKSTLWASLLPAGSLLVCNEPVRSRANILYENLAKWGSPDVVVTNAYPADFAVLEDFFDVVAADVPCSGEGMFRKDDGARAEWSMSNVKMCAKRQMEIIRDVWPALRPGGFLIYSTCTFNKFEDEENVERICSELGAKPLPLPPVAGAVGYGNDGIGGLHFYPHRVKGEGFFIALLQKNATDGSVCSAVSKEKERKGKGKRREEVLPVASEELSKWLRKPDDFNLFSFAAEQVSAVRSSLYPDVMRLQGFLLWKRIMGIGVGVAVKKGNKWQPRPELALSSELSATAFTRCELSREEAIAFLRHEAIVLPQDMERGYIVVCYDGHPLGFVNNLGTRANNLYPAEWRIRKQL
ncbi:MAG: rRNA cytosine-C5-methyltransferase [Alloprevotella sp.]|nr:rRNA cytosine-C5-methyltransferase [Alloprevotella sp.]